MVVTSLSLHFQFTLADMHTAIMLTLWLWSAALYPHRRTAFYFAT